MIYDEKEEVRLIQRPLYHINIMDRIESEDEVTKHIILHDKYCESVPDYTPRVLRFDHYPLNAFSGLCTFYKIVCNLYTL